MMTATLNISGMYPQSAKFQIMVNKPNLSKTDLSLRPFNP